MNIKNQAKASAEVRGRYVKHHLSGKRRFGVYLRVIALCTGQLLGSIISLLQAFFTLPPKSVMALQKVMPGEEGYDEAPIAFMQYEGKGKLSIQNPHGLN